jgi:hypothetical protein
MHLVLPFAAASSPAAAHALSTLSLPQLDRLLARLDSVQRDPGDDYDLSPPHERAVAALRGWAPVDGLLPLAAEAARADGLRPQAGEGWALLSPSHWRVGTEQVSLHNPADLQLDETSSRAVFEAVRPLFEEATGEHSGWQLLWGAPTRWYAVHPSLATLPSASLDRVVGRNVDLWLNQHPSDPALLRRLRRLQAEVQMLLYTHPLNDAREAAGLQPINSFWLSGSGAALAPGSHPLPAEVVVDERLRAPALAEDWAAWAEAWTALDSTVMPDLLRRTQAGEPVQLTLCGERHAERFASQPRAWWQRGPLAPRRPAAATLLAAL